MKSILDRSFQLHQQRRNRPAKTFARIRREQRSSGSRRRRRKPTCSRRFARCASARSDAAGAAIMAAGRRARVCAGVPVPARFRAKRLRLSQQGWRLRRPLTFGAVVGLATYLLLLLVPAMARGCGSSPPGTSARRPRSRHVPGAAQGRTGGDGRTRAARQDAGQWVV